MCDDPMCEVQKRELRREVDRLREQVREQQTHLTTVPGLVRQAYENGSEEAL